MQLKDIEQNIADAIEKAAGPGPATAFDLGLAALQTHAREHPDECATVCLAASLNFYVGMAQRRIAQAVRPIDTRQGLLAFPQYNQIPLVIEIEGVVQELGESTLAEYRASTEALRTRLKSYEYPRVSNERQRREKKELVQREKLDRQISPLMDVNMKMRDGFAALERLGGRTMADRQDRAAKGGKAKQLKRKLPDEESTT